MPQGRALDERGMLIKKALNGAFFFARPKLGNQRLAAQAF